MMRKLFPQCLLLHQTLSLMEIISLCWRCSPGLGNLIEKIWNNSKSYLVTSPCLYQRVRSSPESSWSVFWQNSISNWPPSHGSPSGQFRDHPSPPWHPQMMTIERDHYCPASSMPSPHYSSFSQAQAQLRRSQAGLQRQSQMSSSSPRQRRESGEGGEMSFSSDRV